MKSGFPRLLEQLQQAAGGRTDGQLLARFLSARDEESFAALLRRHGPMVLAVCRRVLRDFHDAEDAFQATFMVLAAKASAVVRRESVGCWLYAVAYHTALAAANANARRRVRERQVESMPQPEVKPAPSPAGTPDWQPHLDRELNRLSEKYRAAVVLCDLEGVPHKEAARLLGVPPGTVSSRLVRARALLAKRLAARGLTLSASALAALVAADTALAQVPAALAGATARVAALVAAGQLAAATGPAVVLMKGVMKVMLMKKLKLVVGTLAVMAGLGSVGLAWRPGGQAWAQTAEIQKALEVKLAAGPPDGKPLSELEALRRENEDLRATVRVLLKELRSAGLEREGSGMKALPGSMPPPIDLPRREGEGEKAYRALPPQDQGRGQGSPRDGQDLRLPKDNSSRPNGQDVRPVAAAEQELEAALKQLREARDAEGRQRATDALEKAVKRLRDEINPGLNLPRGR